MEAMPEEDVCSVCQQREMLFCEDLCFRPSAERPHFTFRVLPSCSGAEGCIFNRRRWRFGRPAAPASSEASWQENTERGCSETPRFAEPFSAGCSSKSFKLYSPKEPPNGGSFPPFHPGAMLDRDVG
ncbi:hypothetical protein LDENG_00251380 [Lucifuga dentata]|nr:hypothetical protein LDENG_00251380 [Lucifuga dentata]